MKDDTSRGVWRSIFLPLVGEDARRAGEGAAVPRETELEQAQSTPSPAPAGAPSPTRGEGKQTPVHAMGCGDK
ncbi:hypothetical protein FACS189475_06660 [Betaproteobacteria bacterium]|nr:hypothetical protein FACS189475_06660 [Betaproteobacteria bacterium]